MCDYSNLTNETTIVWLTPLADLPRYVREIAPTAGRRTGPVSLAGTNGRLVGYAELRPGTPNDGWPWCFRRRCFYLAPWDPYPGGPCEAVDPRTVAAGVSSGRVG